MLVGGREVGEAIRSPLREVLSGMGTHRIWSTGTPASWWTHHPTVSKGVWKAHTGCVSISRTLQFLHHLDILSFLSLDVNFLTSAWEYTRASKSPCCSKRNPVSLFLFAHPEGNPRAAAQDLHCRVHDVDFLTCHWVVGSEAPDDVQYCLYMEDLK